MEFWIFFFGLVLVVVLPLLAKFEVDRMVVCIVTSTGFVLGEFSIAVLSSIKLLVNVGIAITPISIVVGSILPR